MVLLCRILLEVDENKTYFKSGEEISGVLKYSFDKPTKIESIVLSLKGDGRISWSKLKTWNRGTAYVSTEEYVNVLEFVQKTENIIEPGNYEHPFSFVIPNHIPSSFKDDVGKITYKIIAHFSRALLGFLDNSRTFVREIKVLGSLEPCHPQPIIFGLTKIPFSIRSKGKKSFILKITLEKTFFKPGEDIKIKCSINNDTNIPLKDIKAKLVRHTTYKMVNSKQKKVKKKVLKECVGVASKIRKDSVNILVNAENDDSRKTIINMSLDNGLTSKTGNDNIILKGYKQSSPCDNILLENNISLKENDNMNLEIDYSLLKLYDNLNSEIDNVNLDSDFFKNNMVISEDSFTTANDNISSKKVTLQSKMNNLNTVTKQDNSSIENHNRNSKVDWPLQIEHDDTNSINNNVYPSNDTLLSKQHSSRVEKDNINPEIDTLNIKNDILRNENDNIHLIQINLKNEDTELSSEIDLPFRQMCDVIHSKKKKINSENYFVLVENETVTSKHNTSNISETTIDTSKNDKININTCKVGTTTTIKNTSLLKNSNSNGILFTSISSENNTRLTNNNIRNLKNDSIFTNVNNIINSNKCISVNKNNYISLDTELLTKPNDNVMLRKDNVCNENEILLIENHRNSSENDHLLTENEISTSENDLSLKNVSNEYSKEDNISAKSDISLSGYDISRLENYLLDRKINNDNISLKQNNVNIGNRYMHLENVISLIEHDSTSQSDLTVRKINDNINTKNNNTGLENVVSLIENSNKKLENYLSEKKVNDDIISNQDNINVKNSNKCLENVIYLTEYDSRSKNYLTARKTNNNISTENFMSLKEKSNDSLYNYLSVRKIKNNMSFGNDHLNSENGSSFRKNNKSSSENNLSIRKVDNNVSLKKYSTSDNVSINKKYFLTSNGNRQSGDDLFGKKLDDDINFKNNNMSPENCISLTADDNGELVNGLAVREIKISMNLENDNITSENDVSLITYDDNGSDIVSTENSNSITKYDSTRSENELSLRTVNDHMILGKDNVNLENHTSLIENDNSNSENDLSSVKDNVGSECDKNDNIYLENDNITELICIVPTKADLCSIQHSNILEKKYMLNVTARFPFPHKNASVQIPVAIGEVMCEGSEAEKNQARKCTSWEFKLVLHHD